MDPFQMVVAIVVVVMVAKIAQEWLQHRSRAPESDDGTREELQRLRERVEALEAIVTDGREDLRRRFEELEREARARSRAN